MCREITEKIGHSSTKYVDAILGTKPSSAPVTLLQSGSNAVLMDSESVDGKVPSVIFHSYGMVYIYIVDETQVPPEFEDEDLTYVAGYAQDENTNLQRQG